VGRNNDRAVGVKQILIGLNFLGRRLHGFLEIADFARRACSRMARAIRERLFLARERLFEGLDFGLDLIAGHRSRASEAKHHKDQCD